MKLKDIFRISKNDLKEEVKEIQKQELNNIFLRAFQTQEGQISKLKVIATTILVALSALGYNFWDSEIVKTVLSFL